VALPINISDLINHQSEKGKDTEIREGLLYSKTGKHDPGQQS